MRISWDGSAEDAHCLNVCLITSLEASVSSNRLPRVPSMLLSSVIISRVQLDIYGKIALNPLAPQVRKNTCMKLKGLFIFFNMIENRRAYD